MVVLAARAWQLIVGGDAATVMVSVAVTPAVAWLVFTEEIDQWWQRGIRFRNGGAGVSRMQLEPGVGGRFFEVLGEGDAARVVEIGLITRWQPPDRLELTWRNSNFAAHESTFLEITFEAFGQGTRVTVKHHGWAALPADHPARHGQDAAQFIRATGLWWGQLLSVLRDHASRGRGVVAT